MFRHRSARHHVSRAAAYACEPLERRWLLSTFSWTNEGSDNFGVYGGNAGLARSIVHRAMQFWEKVIVNFNHAVPFTNLFNLTVNASGGGIASGGSTAWDSDGVPRSGSISVGTGATTHFFDSTADDAEFTAGLVTRFRAHSDSFSSYDFYTTMLHEIGHCVGVDYGTPLAITPFVTDTGIDDPNDPAPGNLLAFNIGGGPIEATFTDADRGHLWEGPPTPATIAAGLPTHPNDLMNSGRALPPNDRFLISDTDATLLQQAYGYSIKLPSQIDTFYAVLNSTTGQVIVQGDAGASNDTIAVAVNGTNLLVDVNGTHEEIPLSSVTSLVVNAGDGNDTIFFDSIDAGTPTVINAGNGNDFIHIANLGQNLDAVDSNLTVNGDGGSDEMELWDQNNTFGDTYTITSTTFARTVFPVLTIGSSTELLDLFCGSGSNPINVNSTRSGSDWFITGGNGNDTLNWGNATIGVNGNAGTATFDGQGGSDAINFIDTPTVSSFVYSVTNATVGRSASATLTDFNVETLTVNCGSAGDTINVGTGMNNMPMTLNANGGNDTFNVILTSYTGSATNGTIVLNGGTGADAINANDTSTAVATTVVIQTTTFNRTNTPDFDFGTAESLTFNAGLGDDIFLIVSTAASTPLVVHGGGGDDTFGVGNALFASSLNQILGAVSVFGDSGTGDELQVWDNSNTAANTFNINNTTVDTNTSAAATYSTVESMLITCGTGNDVVNLNTTEGSIGITVNANNGNDAIDVLVSGYTGSGAEPTIVLNGEAGTDAINVDDLANATGTTFSVNGAAFSRTFSPNYQYNTAESLTYFAGTGNDTINVTGSIAACPITINANNGNDSINFGNAASLNPLAGPVTVNGQVGTDSVTFGDAGNGLAATYTATSTSLTRAGIALLTYATAETITLNAGSNADTVNLNSVLAGTAWTINGGNGNDTLNINTGALGDQIAGAVTFNGQLNSDQAIFNDNLSSFTFDYAITTTTLTRPGSIFPGLTYGTTEILTLNAGAANNNVDVNSTPAAATWNINCGDGADTIDIGSGLLSDVAGPVSVSGGAGTSDFIRLNDNANATANGFDLALGSIDSDQSAAVTYSAVEFLTVNAGGGDDDFRVEVTSPTVSYNLNGNAGADDFQISPSAHTLNGLAGTLQVNGGSGSSDSLTVHDEANPGASSTYSFTGTAVQRTGTAATGYSAVESITLLASNVGNDQINVTGTAPNSAVGINGGGGTDTFAVSATDITAPVTVLPSVGNDIVQVNLDATGTAGVLFDATQRLGSLSIGSGGVATLTAGGSKVLTTAALSVTGTGKLDLNDNDLILDYTGASQLAAVQALINAARNGGAWNGAGLTSSTAAANAQHNTTLGAMEATDFKAIYGAGALFDGQTIDTTAVIVKYTWYGDADFNGKVNFDDYVRTDSGFNNHLSGWSNGDYDGNGTINFDDYVLIDLAFNTQSGVL
jgi:hypothetical protein